MVSLERRHARRKARNTESRRLLFAREGSTAGTGTDERIRCISYDATPARHGTNGRVGGSSYR
ncbi:hypothetical protein EI94DRAFT_1734347 [Lactarius quietus]|nr:hypothetical protein EI94DRAFT_1734347 [Lactarius quietus]